MKLVIVRMGRAACLLLVLGLALLLGGCGSGRPAGQALAPTSAPPTVAAKVVWTGSYARDIQPIFDQKCTPCHSQARAENGLRLDSYQGVMKGTQFGPVVQAGVPTGSTLVSVVSGTADPKIRMPHLGQRLTPQEVQNITLWIDAGAPNN